MTDIAHLQVYITWVITALAGAFGIGVGYAVLKTDLAAFKHEFRIFKETASAASAAAAIVASEQLTTIKERIKTVESKMELQVGYDRCRDMRSDCNDRIVAQLQELSKQVQANREVVMNQMRETEKFIGKVEALMLKNGG
jgi:archaellum component FlaC